MPLINNKLTIEDIEPETSFVQLSLTDKNKPYIENCIFLMYKVKSTIEQFTTFNKLRTLDNYYSSYTYVIDQKDYEIYAFTIKPEYKQDIKFIEQGLYTYISLIDKYRILSFYNTDSEVFYKLFDITNNKELIDEIPEKDYYASLIDLV